MPGVSTAHGTVVMGCRREVQREFMEAANACDVSKMESLWQKAPDRHEAFLSEKNGSGNTAFDLATTEILNWLWQKVQENSIDIIQCAAKSGNIELMSRIWDRIDSLSEDDFLASRLDTPVTVRKECLLTASDFRGNTVFHIAAFYGKNEVLDWLWGKTEEGLKDSILSKVNNASHTVFHVAAIGGNVESIQWVWEHTKESKRIDLLKSVNHYGHTAFYLAAYSDKADACRWIWDKCEFNKLQLFTSYGESCEVNR